jgi:hypothetical protein
MSLVIHLHQPSEVDMGIALGRGQRRVSQQLLDGSQIGAIFEQVGRKRVAQQVGVNGPPERSAKSSIAQMGSHRSGGQAPAPAVEEERCLGWQRSQRATNPEVALDPCDGRIPQRNDSFAPPLAQDPHRLASKIDASQIQPGELSDSKAARVKELPDCSVSNRKRALGWIRLEERENLLGSRHVWKLS